MDNREKTTDNETLFKMRLGVETNVNANTVFRETEPIAYRLEKEELQKLMEACESEEEYQTWKEAFLDRMVEEMKGTHFLTCKHTFEGIGTFNRVLPQEQLDDFRKWTKKTPGLKLNGQRPSTEEEIREYIALNARAL